MQLSSTIDIIYWFKYIFKFQFVCHNICGRVGNKSICTIVQILILSFTKFKILYFQLFATAFVEELTTSSMVRASTSHVTGLLLHPAILTVFQNKQVLFNFKQTRFIKFHKDLISIFLLPTVWKNSKPDLFSLTPHRPWHGTVGW